MKITIRSVLQGMFFLFTQLSHTQTTVTEIYSDYNGYWFSSTSSVSTVSPSNSHNLLAFKYKDVVYSTGVNDALLTTQGVSFVPQTYEALPLVGDINSGIIGVGYDYGGSGAVSPSPVINDPGFYLTDGMHGLNIGTGIFNTAGTNTYAITFIDPLSIGDNIPDIIVPQSGDIPGGSDVFYFTRSNNLIVGNFINANFSSVAILARGNWKFYTRANPPVIGAATAGLRAMRCIGFDFADLGITTSNYTQVAYFVHTLSGNSDQPFVAYNKSSIVILPVRWGKIAAYKQQGGVTIEWETYTEINNKEFVVERSDDMENWSALVTIPSKGGHGNSNHPLSYFFEDNQPLSGDNYYRIKQIDWNGNVDYSEIKVVSVATTKLKVFPNPTSDIIYVMNLSTKAEVKIFNLSAQCIYTGGLNEKEIYYPISLESLPSGVYLLEIKESSMQRIVYKVIKN